MRLTLGEHGIKTAGAATATEFSWPAFRTLSESDDLVVVWLDRARGLIDSGRAFASAEERTRYVDTVPAHLPQTPKGSGSNPG